MSSIPRYEAFAVTSPGLEPLAAAELQALGATDAQAIAGGVTFGASQQLLYAANLHLRTASRVVVRVSAFGAKAFHELERRSGKVPWEAFVSPNLGVALRVTCRKSRLYHSDAVAERVASAIAARVRGARVVADAGDEGDLTDAPDQLVIVRLLHDQCSVSIDSSGALLHLRGYRQAVAKAPMRETLAAAALLGSGWQGDAPLLDPLCGSGTIPIEAALIARRIPPGLRRGFAFERWPDFDSVGWREIRAEAEAAMLPASPVPIQGSDRDAGAIEAARANAERAGVRADIEFSERALSAVEPPAGRGWVVTNPPYGVRVGDRDRLRNLYAQLGKVVRAKCDGWRVALLAAVPELERQTGLGLKPVLRTSNGGIPVRLVVGDVGARAEPARRRRRPTPKFNEPTEIQGAE
jgi:putative N6-adenine-specific DNA methylase